MEMDESTKQIAERFQCKYRVFERGTDPKQVEEAYRDAYAAGQKEGFFPAVVLLDEYVVEWLNEVAAGEYDRDQIIANCKDNGKEILEERFAEYTDDFDEEAFAEFIGNETTGDALDQFIGYMSFNDGMLEADTLLLFVPVKNPWEIVAYVPLGGWNECPAADDMIAICKYWYEKYKAVPASFTHDVMEFYAPCGINGVDSLEAAKEHYAFCMDRVDQGTRTYKLSELAMGLAESEVWYFWWD